MLACSNTSQCKNCTQRNVDKSGKQRHTTIASKRSEVSFSIQYYGMKWMSTNGMMGTKILTANNNSIKSVIWKQILYSFTALIIMRWSFWSVRSHHTTVYTSHNRSRAAKEQRQQQQHQSNIRIARNRKRNQGAAFMRIAYTHVTHLSNYCCTYIVNYF